MPDLDRLIAGWRASVTPLFRDRDDVLDELESHLRDEIDRRTADGLDPETALSAAAEKLGSPAAIAAEFARVPPPPRPWLPVHVAWAAAAVGAAGTLLMILPRLSRGGADALLAGHVGGVTLGYLVSLLVGGLAVCFLLARLVREPGAGQRTTIRRDATRLTALAVLLTASGIALGTFCPFEKHGWCWGLDTREVGGLVIAGWNALLLGCLWSGRRANQIRGLMALGVVGAVVVVLGWLAAAQVEDHSYGFLSSVPTVAVAVALLLIVSLTALAPAGCLSPRRNAFSPLSPGTPGERGRG